MFGVQLDGFLEAQSGFAYIIGADVSQPKLVVDLGIAGLSL